MFKKIYKSDFTDLSVIQLKKHLETADFCLCKILVDIYKSATFKLDNRPQESHLELLRKNFFKFAFAHRNPPKTTSSTM